METVFGDIDLTTLVLRSLVAAYAEEAQRSCNDRRGPSLPVQEMRVTTLRTMLRQAVRVLSRSGHVCKLWKTASTAAFSALLETVESQFQAMRAGTLDFLRGEPAIYEGASLAPGVPREEAIRVLSNTWSGRIVLEPMRVCFEVPVPTGSCGSNAGPIGNIRNAIAPYRQSFPHWAPTDLARKARTAGHWLRVWIAELTWVDSPTYNPEALWLAVNRGCPVCGKRCTLQAHRVNLANAEHCSTDELAVAMSMDERATGEARNPWVGMNAYLEIPWDLPDVHKRLIGKVPPDPVTRLATRILPYAHRAHMVTLKFKYVSDAAVGFVPGTRGPVRRDYAYGFAIPPGIDHRTYDKSEDEIMLDSVIRALVSGTPHPTIPGWDYDAFIDELFVRRRDAIQNSGLYKYMVDSGMEQDAIRKVFCPREIWATLPLFPMHGHPEAHSWSHMLNLTKEQFQTLAWRCGNGDADLGGVTSNLEEWRKQAMRHMIAFLSYRLPQFDHSAFYRVSEIQLLAGNAASIPLQSLSDPYPARVLNPSEHSLFIGNPGTEDVTAAAFANRLLLETWQDFQDLFAHDVDKHLHILNRQSRFDVTYDQMLAHFLRLDSVVGPAWRQLTSIGFLDAEDEEDKPVFAQSMLLRLVLCHLKKTPDLEPAPLNIAHSRAIPGAPHHPNVWLRWFLNALAKPSVHPTGLDTGADWEYRLEVDVRNTFLIDANRQDKDCVDFDNVGVHVTYSVESSRRENRPEPVPMHMRLSVGMRLSALGAIRDGVRHTKTELAEGEPLGSRDAANTFGSVKAVVPRDLVEWHQDARVTCQTLTRQVRRSRPLAYDLLRRFLDAEWTPATQKQGLEADPKWVEGWHALRSHCLPGCEWFTSTGSLLPFCKVRGLSKCACAGRCSGFS